MPEVVLNGKKFVFDAFRFEQGIKTLGVITNGAIEDVGLLDDVAREVTLLENFFKRPTLRVIGVVVAFRIGKDVTAFWVIEPKEWRKTL